MAVRTTSEKALKPLLIGQPWLYVGLPKTAWDRLMREGKAPRPVALPVAAHPRWRAEDLDAFVASLPLSERSADTEEEGDSDDEA